MLDQNSYDTHKNRENILKLRIVLRELPPFCRDFFRAIEPNTSILTRINYAYDLRLFFEFLTNEVTEFTHIQPFSKFTLEDLNLVQAVHIEMFLEYLTYYSRPSTPEIEHQNSESGKARKLSTLRSFLAYYFKNEKIDRNVASLVDHPKIHEKPVIRLEPDEVARLLDLVESGQGLTERQKHYHKYTKQRDVTILTLFLGTGIRISECVGLNISDLDFSVNGFRITRKGGNQVILYFGDEVRKALLDYLEEREKIEALPGHEDALFLSMQRKRISNRAVQNLVKKYSKIVTPLKNISPHKLRSTYGTALYQETGDIYLVADVLGHKDVNTTRKHYAAISDEKRRMAARVVKLRED
ncbi:MAG: tyrosine-type recombinase/integrase [Clostridiales bacterium]|jgi:site-specific recombinase XerD|nr:tyrosine-type recombinase/integrase [Clostridiales bacterium]